MTCPHGTARRCGPRAGTHVTGWCIPPTPLAPCAYTRVGVVVAVLQSLARVSDEVLAGDHASNEVALCFVSADHGVLLQEYQSLDAAGEAVVGRTQPLCCAVVERAAMLQRSPGPHPSSSTSSGSNAPHACVVSRSARLLRAVWGAGAKSFVGLQAPHLVLNKPTKAEGFVSHAQRVLMQGFAGIQVRKKGTQRNACSILFVHAALLQPCSGRNRPPGPTHLAVACVRAGVTCAGCRTATRRPRRRCSTFPTTWPRATWTRPSAPSRCVARAHVTTHARSLR